MPNKTDEDLKKISKLPESAQSYLMALQKKREMLNAKNTGTGEEMVKDQRRIAKSLKKNYELQSAPRNNLKNQDRPVQNKEAAAKFEEQQRRNNALGPAITNPRPPVEKKETWAADIFNQKPGEFLQSLQRKPSLPRVVKK